MALPLSELNGIGTVRLAAFNAAGVFSAEDLINRLPVDYRDLSVHKPLCALSAGESAAVCVRVTGGVRLSKSGKLAIVSVAVTDDTGTLTAVWYNQPWIKAQLSPGRQYLLFGRIERYKDKLQISNPSFETGTGIVPVYRALPGIPLKTYAKAVGVVLDVVCASAEDALPEALRNAYNLCGRSVALRNAHMPGSLLDLTAARRRLAFEELMLYQIGLGLMRGIRAQGVQIDADAALFEAFWSSLPFMPTGAQLRAAEEIRADLRATMPMARMVQGDVGCGKTAVAFAAMYAVARCGMQSALMVPTEVLAAQHLASAEKMLAPLGISCGLLTGSLNAKARRDAYAAIRDGTWQVIIGTHALITEGLKYANLGLVITDEQHRFGVRQRTLLSAKGDAPNALVMSATPIPRTLSLILYGDLDITIIDELPPGRIPVKTSLVPDAKRPAMYDFIRKEVAEGRQAYIVCPLVEESEAVDAADAESLYESLKTGELAGLRIRMVHGRMKPAEKDAVLNAFHAGAFDVLVSTTVIEVGVNVPNAGIMVIENAERFGLAQLHQLRGRVGRGAIKSWCFLMAEPTERLRLMTKTNDGFIVAEKDLELRGPGDMMGYRQSGAVMPVMNGRGFDAALLNEAHQAAREIIQNAGLPEYRLIIERARAVCEAHFSDIGMN